MEALPFSKECRFNRARQQIYSHFNSLEKKLNKIRDRLYEEINLKEQEWRKSIEALKNTRDLVSDKLPPNIATNKTKQRVLATFDLSVAREPYIEIKWDLPVKLSELDGDTQIAEVIYFIPDIEEQGRNSFRNVRPVNESGYGLHRRRNALSQGFSDLEITPNREKTFNFDGIGTMTKSNSSHSTFDPKVQNSNSTEPPSVKLSNDTSTRQETFSKSCELVNKRSYDSFQVPKQNFELPYERSAYHEFDKERVSHSVPHSPSPREVLPNWINQSFDDFGQIKFCDPKERDCLIQTDEEWPPFFFPSSGRRKTVVQIPKCKEEKQENCQLVSERIKKCENITKKDRDRAYSMQERSIYPQNGKDKFTVV